MKWMLFTRKPQPNPFFLLSPGIMRSDIVLFSMCEVKSFDIPLIPSKESIWKEKHGHDTHKKEPMVQKSGGLDKEFVFILKASSFLS